MKRHFVYFFISMLFFRQAFCDEDLLKTGKYEIWFFFDGITNYFVRIAQESDGTFECTMNLPSKHTTVKNCRYLENLVRCPMTGDEIRFSDDHKKAYYSNYTLYPDVNMGAPAFTGHWVSKKNVSKKLYIIMKTNQLFHVSEYPPEQLIKRIYECSASSSVQNRYVCPDNEDKNIYFDYDDVNNQINFNRNDRISIYGPVG